MNKSNSIMIQKMLNSENQKDKINREMLQKPQVRRNDFF